MFHASEPHERGLAALTQSTGAKPLPSALSRLAFIVVVPVALVAFSSLATASPSPGGSSSSGDVLVAEGSGSGAPGQTASTQTGVSSSGAPSGATETNGSSGGPTGGSAGPTSSPAGSSAGGTDGSATGPTETPGSTPTARSTSGASTPKTRPTPSPARSSAPTPAPTQAPIAGGTPVPDSIDATGSSDVSAALNSWIATVPNGSTIVFKAGGKYRLGAAIKPSQKRNLTFEGNGATLVAAGGTTESSSIFWLASNGGGNSGIVIRDFTLVGNSTSPGVYKAGREGAHGVLVDGGSGITITNITVSAVWGDCLYVGGFASGVTFQNSTCRSNGRNGVAIISGSNVTVQGDHFDRSGYTTFDMEPNNSSESVNGVRFLNNTAGTWSNSFVSADGAAGSAIANVTISGNTVTGASMLTVIDLARRQNVTFTNNRSTVTGAGPVLRFAHIDGLTVTGNVQPLSSGQLASISSDCTSVTYS